MLHSVSWSNFPSFLYVLTRKPPWLWRGFLVLRLGGGRAGCPGLQWLRGIACEVVCSNIAESASVVVVVVVVVVLSRPRVLCHMHMVRTLGSKTEKKPPRWRRGLGLGKNVGFQEFCVNIELDSHPTFEGCFVVQPGNTATANQCAYRAMGL